MPGYYDHPNVRARILEYLGGGSLDQATCVYLTCGDASDSHHREPRNLSDLMDCLDKGLDISRSLWDRKSLIAHLDVEYVNFDYPTAAFFEPERIFDLQRPVESAIEAVLRDYDLAPLHLLSGRGHHFVWRIRQNSRAFKRLAALGRLTPTLKQLYARPHRPTGETISPVLGAAFAGLGLVMEYLAHRIKEVAAPLCRIPVELTAVEVGPSRRGREMVSLDISEYGDPLSTRVIRVPFSLYLKPWQQRGRSSEARMEQLPPVFLIPLHEMDSRHGIQTMRDIPKVIELARSASAKIPDQSKPMEQLVAAYTGSSLARFHESFYAQEHDPPEDWPEHYDRTPLDPLSRCARHILEHPNDLLLKPGEIERIVRVLLALGWHPRHIAGLIRSKYERDANWGTQWRGYDPATRADFYTRLFAGLFVVGRDDLIDFNCQSAKEKQLCLFTECPDNLEQFRKSLLARRTYERLARRPFNRLFLPEQHS